MKIIIANVLRLVAVLAFVCMLAGAGCSDFYISLLVFNLSGFICGVAFFEAERLDPPPDPAKQEDVGSPRNRKGRAQMDGKE